MIFLSSQNYDIMSSKQDTTYVKSTISRYAFIKNSNRLGEQMNNGHEEVANTSRSEDELSGNKRPRQTKPKLSKKMKNYLMVVLAVLIVGSGAYVIAPTFMGDIVVYTSPYDFQVYCPVNKVPQELYMSETISSTFDNRNDDLRFLTSEVYNKIKADDGIDKYIVWVQMHRVNSSTNVSKLFYCSFVTDWGANDCSKATKKCTLPGPLFYVEKDKPIDVAWVHDIRNEDGSKHFEKPMSDCLNISKAPTPKCFLYRKSDDKDICTYLSPTNNIPKDTYPNNKDFQISVKNIPMVTHIHGLEVRPTFDGNPMSWIGKGGKLGLGFQSILKGEEYYSENNLFRNPTTTGFMVAPGQDQIYVKVNRYENVQPPGNLWYHDHAMDLTRANVFHGLSGNYIIYANETEDALPSKDYNIIIIAGQHMVNNTVFEDPNNGLNTHQMQDNPEKVSFYIRNKKGDILERNQVYRVRILNGQYDSRFTHLSFLAQCKNYNNVSALTCKQLKFSVIGSDSALFHNPVHYVSHVNISSAERIQLLIVFDGKIGQRHENRIRKGPNEKVFLVSGNSQRPGDASSTIKQIFTLEEVSDANKYGKFPSELDAIPGTHFYNLSQINQSCSDSKKEPPYCISLTRTKSIMIPDNKWMINGHPDFSATGKTDNPRIGTTEDWIFYSFTAIHPIHIHLINFQVMAYAQMKMHTDGCYFAQMDYWIQAKVLTCCSSDSNSNCVNCSDYADICKQSKSINFSSPEVKKKMSEAFPEDAEPINNVVGFNIKDTTNPEETNIDSTCTNSHYRYLCQEPTNKNIPKWYQGWKEVGIIPQGYIMIFRIRWTSTDYPFQGRDDSPYFRIPEDQLLQYPGFVYHCHFLNHEDNGLMRSFQMLPSDQFESRYNVSGTDLGNCMKNCGHNKDGDGWKARYQCMNKLTGCTQKACQK